MVGQLDGCGQLVALLEVEVLSKPAIEDEAQFPVEFHNGIWEHSLKPKFYLI